MDLQSQHKEDLKNQILGGPQIKYLMKSEIKKNMIMLYLSSGQI